MAELCRDQVDATHSCTRKDWKVSVAERHRSEFTTTRWSLVLALRDQTSEEAEKALVELCSRYWFPLYAFVRKSGYGREDAEDLTQDFFAQFLEKGYFARADPKRGRFHDFLRTSIRNFMLKQWRRERTRKRGGGAARVPWDQANAEGRFASDLAEEGTPEILSDQQWAKSLADRALAALDRDFARRNKMEVLQQIKQHLWGEARGVSYAELADRAQLSVIAFKSIVHRVRQKYRDLLRAEVAETVADPTEVDDELRHLVMVLSEGTRV